MERDFIGLSKKFYASLAQSLIHRFWHFIRRRTGKGVADTQTAFSDFF